MRKKVLYVVTKSGFGGAQRYVYDLAVNLPKDQYDVAVACGVQEGNDELIRRLAANDIPTLEIPHLARDVVFIKEVRAFLAMLDIVQAARPDILHVNSSKAAGLGALAGRVLGVKKIIFTIHGWPFRERRNILWRFGVWIISLITLLLATRAIAVSEKDFLDSPLQGKTIIIKNGVENREALSRNDARETLSPQSAGNELWVGTIAELTKNKGVDVLVRAVERVEEVRVLLIGDGEDRGKLKKLVSSLGIQDRVLFLGNIPDASRLLRALDVFVLPSRKEGLPYTLLEAGMAELPVVASAVGGIPEVIRDKETGLLVPPENETALASALKGLIEAPEKRTWFGRNLRALVEREYSFKEMLEKTLKAYSG